MKRKFEEVLQDVRTERLNKDIAQPKKTKPDVAPDPLDGVRAPKVSQNLNVCSDKRQRFDVPHKSVRYRLPGNHAFQDGRINDLFNQHASINDSPLVLAFFDPLSVEGQKDSPIHELDRVLAARYSSSIVAVTDAMDPENDGTSNLRITQIEDASGSLALELQALNPIGGGSTPLDCLVFLDHKLNRRAFVPLAKVKRQQFIGMVESSLEYLMWEQHQGL